VQGLCFGRSDGSRSSAACAFAWRWASASKFARAIFESAQHDRRNGDPAWLLDQVTSAASELKSDVRRVALIGWSGGASYMGYRWPAWQAPITSLVFLGGGMPPDAAAACPTVLLPSYYVSGTQNPLRGLALDLRKRIEACQAKVQWSSLEGADHGAEWREVSSEARIRAIVNFVQTHPAPALVAQVEAVATPTVSASQEVPPNAVYSAPTVLVPARVAPRASCNLAGTQGSVVIEAWILGVLRMRRVRRGQPTLLTGLPSTQR
jgi:predicted esterase